MNLIKLFHTNIQTQTTIRDKFIDFYNNILKSYIKNDFSLVENVFNRTLTV